MYSSISMQYSWVVTLIYGCLLKMVMGDTKGNVCHTELKHRVIVSVCLFEWHMSSTRNSWCILLQFCIMFWSALIYSMRCVAQRALQLELLNGLKWTTSARQTATTNFLIIFKTPAHTKPFLFTQYLCLRSTYTSSGWKKVCIFSNPGIWVQNMLCRKPIWNIAILKIAVF